MIQKIIKITSIIIKRSSNRKKRHTLISTISTDLLQNGKLHLCLFTFTIITALLVVTSAYYTRILRMQLEQLFLEHDFLDAEWRNLILEENLFTDYRQIKHVSTKILQTKHISHPRKNILVQKIKENIVHESSSQNSENKTSRRTTYLH